MNTVFRPLLATAALLLIGTIGLSSQALAATEGERLNAFFDEYFQAQLKLNPIQATFIGDPRFNYYVPNGLGPAWEVVNPILEKHWLGRIKSEFSREKLEGQERLSYDIFVSQREQGIEGDRFPGQLQPITQFFSLPSFIAQLGSGRSAQPFATARDYEDWVMRMDMIPVIFNQSIVNMRLGIEQNVTQPRPAMEKALPQIQAHVVDNVEDSVFWGPVANMPEAISDEDRERLTEAMRHSIENKVIPAYRSLANFLRDEYLPASRTTVGYWALPDGEEWYEFQVRANTTVDMSPEEIHQLGLREVARIRSEMEQVMAQVGFEGDLQDFFKYVQEDDQFYFDNAEDLLQGYRDLQTKVNEKLPSMFDIFPKADYEVRAIEAFRAESSAGASYQPAAPDGSRPGIFYVNTHNLRAQPKFIMETLSLHEASPGHHFQISIQQELESLPAFRRFGGYTAFSEGWALYVESIGKEMGMFEDPMQYYGKLSDEMLRAMRLVVDTGLHYKKWTREQAIDYMLENSSMAESDVIAEVERYIVIPGQALAYKIGQLSILEMRAKAEAALGDDFDIKAFHRQILVDGALPMDVLARKMDEWVQAQL